MARAWLSVALLLAYGAVAARGVKNLGTGSGGLLPGNEIPSLPSGPFGTAVVTVMKIPNSALSYVYFELTQTGLTNITASHIHVGNSTVSGPVVIPFTEAIDFTSFETEGFATGSVKVPSNITKDLDANPSGYYVNIHTVAQPAGALRAQLSNLVKTPVKLPYDSYVEDLTTAADNATVIASGSATISLNQYMSSDNVSLGFSISVVNITDITLAHIHEGSAGVAGNVVVSFVPQINFTDFSSTEFASGHVDIDTALADKIRANPSGFYVNVHSVAYPNGVLRGQLSTAEALYSGAPAPSPAAGSSPAAIVPAPAPAPAPSAASLATMPTWRAIIGGGAVALLALVSPFM